MNQHNQNPPVVRRLNFELQGCKVKASQNMVPRSILRFHMVWNLQYLRFKLLGGLEKQHFHVHVKWTFELQLYAILCPDYKTWRAFFSQKQLFTDLVWCHQWNYNNSKSAMSDFKMFLHQNWTERSVIWEVAKKVNFNVWLNWSLPICWVTYVFCLF